MGWSYDSVKLILQQENPVVVTSSRGRRYIPFHQLFHLLRIYQRQTSIRLVTVNQFFTCPWKLMCYEVDNVTRLQIPFHGSRPFRDGARVRRSALVMHKQFQSVTFTPSRSIKANGDSHFFFSFSSLCLSLKSLVKMGFFPGRTFSDKVMERACGVNWIRYLTRGVFQTACRWFLESNF